ncbi:hypothetical protein AC140_37120 [Bacteroides fragilis]|nr:hypothetical protein AC140_37120 [Bacteroides fragilis]
MLFYGRCLFLGYSDGKVFRRATRVEKFSEGFVSHNNKCDRTKHSEKLEKDVSVFRKRLRLSGRMYPSFSWEGACLYPERGLCSIRNLSLRSQRQLFPDPFLPVGSKSRKGESVKTAICHLFVSINPDYRYHCLFANLYGAIHSYPGISLMYRWIEFHPFADLCSGEFCGIFNIRVFLFWLIKSKTGSFGNRPMAFQACVWLLPAENGASLQMK